MIEDTELLRRYAEEKSEAAFAELVRRHLDLVYSVALRQVGGDAHLAEDVAQQVFTALARKAAGLAGHAALSGWLYRSAHFAASDVVRVERRRRVREQEVHAMNSVLTDDTVPADWEKLRPVLDAAIAELDERDRDAVALRFFDGRSFADVGARLRLTENAARMRVERALDKLHGVLARRGVTSTTTALGTALTQQAAVAAPAGLAVSVTGTATTGALTAGAIGFMSTTKIVTLGAALLAIAAVGFGVVQWMRSQTAATEVAALRQERAALAVQLARAEQRIKQQTAAPTPAVLPPAPPAPPPASTAIPGAPVPPAATFEATKEVLARISMAGGQRWMSLDRQHVDNTHAWIERDPSGLIQWIATLPSEKQREHTTEAVIAVATEKDLEFAFLLTSAIVRDVPRSNRRHEVISTWAERDPLGAARAVANADLPEHDRERLLLVVSAFSRKR